MSPHDFVSHFSSMRSDGEIRSPACLKSMRYFNRFSNSGSSSYAAINKPFLPSSISYWLIQTGDFGTFLTKRSNLLDQLLELLVKFTDFPHKYLFGLEITNTDADISNSSLAMDCSNTWFGLTPHLYSTFDAWTDTTFVFCFHFVQVSARFLKACDK